MVKLFRRVFPTQPVLALALIMVLLAEGGAFAYTVLGYGKAVEGNWSASYTISNGEASPCTYTHQQDQFVAGAGGKILNWGPQHHTTCVAPMQNTNELDLSKLCPVPPPPTCSGAINQDHYEEK